MESTVNLNHDNQSYIMQPVGLSSSNGKLQNVRRIDDEK